MNPEDDGTLFVCGLLLSPNCAEINMSNARRAPARRTKFLRYFSLFFEYTEGLTEIKNFAHILE